MQAAHLCHWGPVRFAECRICSRRSGKPPTRATIRDHHLRISRRTSLVASGLVALQALLPSPVLAEDGEVAQDHNPSIVDPASPSVSLDQSSTTAIHSSGSLDSDPDQENVDETQYQDDAVKSDGEGGPSASGEYLTEDSTSKLLEADEAKILQYKGSKVEQKKVRKGRLRELEETRSQLAEKEIILLMKETELLEKEQTLAVLREELRLERNLRALLTKEKEKAEEEAALAMGLCSGANLLP